MLALAVPVCQGALMEPQNTRAGGCFMMGAILLGFLGGLAIQNPLLGVWVGTGTGLFIVAVLWMLDVRKR